MRRNASCTASSAPGRVVEHDGRRCGTPARTTTSSSPRAPRCPARRASRRLRRSWSHVVKTPPPGVRFDTGCELVEQDRRDLRPAVGTIRRAPGESGETGAPHRNLRAVPHPHTLKRPGHRDQPARTADARDKTTAIRRFSPWLARRSLRASGRWPVPGSSGGRLGEPPTIAIEPGVWHRSAVEHFSRHPVSSSSWPGLHRRWGKSSGSRSPSSARANIRGDEQQAGRGHLPDATSILYGAARSTSTHRPGTTS